MRVLEDGVELERNWKERGDKVVLVLCSKPSMLVVEFCLEYQCSALNAFLISL